MASLISNLVTSNSERSRDSLKQIKKIKKMQKQSSNGRYQTTRNNKNSENNNEMISWKSETRQEIYRSKLMQALSQVRLGSESGSARLRGRAVREAADRVLAMTDKVRSRWSHAILTNNLKSKFVKRNLRQRGVVGKRPLKKPRVGIMKLKSKNLDRKGRDLGRLVPGCRNVSLPIVLEEATDYIAALEMQVKAMAALADLFSSRFNSDSGAVSVSRLDISQPPLRS